MASKRFARVEARRCVACWRGVTAQVDTGRCVGCGRCAKECPAGAIDLKDREGAA